MDDHTDQNNATSSPSKYRVARENARLYAAAQQSGEGAVFVGWAKARLGPQAHHWPPPVEAPLANHFT